MQTILTISLLVAITLTINNDFDRVYNSVSNFLFGGKKLTPKEF